MHIQLPPPPDQIMPTWSYFSSGKLCKGEPETLPLCASFLIKTRPLQHIDASRSSSLALDITSSFVLRVFPHKQKSKWGMTQSPRKY